MVQYIVQYGLVQYSIVQYSIVWYVMVYFGKLRYIMVCYGIFIVYLWYTYRIFIAIYSILRHMATSSEKIIVSDLAAADSPQLGSATLSRA